MPRKAANFNLEQFKYEVANEIGLNPGKGAATAAGAPLAAGTTTSDPPVGQAGTSLQPGAGEKAKSAKNLQTSQQG